MFASPPFNKAWKNGSFSKLNQGLSKLYTDLNNGIFGEAIAGKEYSIGNNRYMVCITTNANIPVGSWIKIYTIDLNAYKDPRIDFGKSYFVAEGIFITAIDGANSSGGMVRLDMRTGAVQVYSSTLSTLRPVVFVAYSK